MLSFLAVAALAGLAFADPNPSTPPTTNVGQPLNILYAVDPTGKWTSTTISLMSGSNLAMKKVVDIDTNHNCVTSPGSLTWTVPDVSPNSEIYFLQFVNNANATAEPVWTTRFTIASATGQTTPPANQVEPDGKAIPWGNAALVGGAASASGAATLPSAASSNASVPIASNAVVAPVVANATSSVAASAAPVTSAAASAAPSTGNVAAVKGDASSMRAGSAFVALGAVLAGLLA